MSTGTAVCRSTAGWTVVSRILIKTHSFTFQSEESLKLELELLNKGNIRSVNLIFVVLQKKSNVNIKVLK